MKKQSFLRVFFLITPCVLSLFVQHNVKAREYKKSKKKSAEITRAYSASAEPCFAIEGKLNWLNKAVGTFCADVSADIQDTQNFVVDTQLLSCGKPTSITQTDIPLTITASGTYCLTENVSTVTPNTAITIDADDVTIDLSNFAVSGGSNTIVIAGGRRNTMLCNGVIQNATPDGTANGYGVFVPNGLRVVLKNITLRGNLVGLLVRFTEDITLDSCSVLENTGAGIVFTASINGEINNTLVHNNSFVSDFEIPGVGVQPSSACAILNSLNFRINNSNFSINSSSGGAWNVVSILGSANCIFTQCIANNNTGTADGFAFLSSDNCLSQNCNSNNNSRGFVANASDRIILDNSVASANAVDGFLLDNSANSCLVECTAKNNTQRGFLVTNTTNNSFVRSCIALSNPTAGYEVSVNSATVLFSNYAENNGASGINNYVVASQDFTPTYTFDLSAGTYTAVAPRTGNVTKWDNISAIP